MDDPTPMQDLVSAPQVVGRIAFEALTNGTVQLDVPRNEAMSWFYYEKLGQTAREFYAKRAAGYAGLVSPDGRNALVT